MVPSSEAVRALADRLISPEVVIYPVRHHSPACAWQLQRLIDDISPCAVLVEGPRSFTPLIPLLVHPQARLPLAVYTYAVQKAAGEGAMRRDAAYYPFCEHSPELVALRCAASRLIPSRFIDLDFAEQCLIDQAHEVDEARSLLDERHYRRSRYLTALALQMGCRDHEELWEHLFEVPVRSRSMREHVADLVAYCHLARSECSPEEMAADGTAQREAEMVWHIRQAIAERQPTDGPVLAVVGGFHAVALPDLLGKDVSRPVVSKRSISDEASALIRYSFDRLDRLNGYSAGMTSPAWQQGLWEAMQKHDKAGITSGPRVRQDLALGFLSDIAHELRQKHGVPLPMPALTGAYEHVLQLAALRERAAPVREDVVDAVTSCFVKGDADADGALILTVTRRALSGNVMGKVPPGAGSPPLVKDFEYRARRQRLKVDDSQPRRVMLDIYRRSDHRITSRLFHGLSLLGVPLAYRTAGPDFVNGVGLDRLQEHWEYTYSAATEAALVEASVYGVTVPLAVANRFGARLDRFDSGTEQRDAKTAAALLVHGCVLGLHDHLPGVLNSLRQVIGSDASFESVSAACSSLGILWESREPLEARDLVELPSMLQSAYERAIFLGGALRGIQGDGSELLHALSSLRELLISAAGAHLDDALYWTMIHALVSDHDVALVRGACAGLLYGAGQISDTQLCIVLHGHLNGLLQTKDAVSFLRGLLHTAREVAWQQPDLLGIVDGLLRQWPDETFVAALPELRLAFSDMTPKETDRIAKAAGHLHGACDLGQLVQHGLSEQDVQSQLTVSQTLIDVLKADGLSGWLAS